MGEGGGSEEFGHPLILTDIVQFKQFSMSFSIIKSNDAAGVDLPSSVTSRKRSRSPEPTSDSVSAASSTLTACQSKKSRMGDVIGRLAQRTTMDESLLDQPGSDSDEEEEAAVDDSPAAADSGTESCAAEESTAAKSAEHAAASPATSASEKTSPADNRSADTAAATTIVSDAVHPASAADADSSKLPTAKVTRGDITITVDVSYRSYFMSRILNI